MQQISVTPKYFNIVNSDLWVLEHNNNTITPAVDIFVADPRDPSKKTRLMPLRTVAVDRNNVHVYFTKRQTGEAIVV